jgi:hypothetical protein
VKFIETKGFYEEKNWESLKDIPYPNSDRAATLRILLETLRGGSTQEASPAPSTPTQDQMEAEPQVEEVDNEAGIDVSNGDVEEDPNAPSQEVEPEQESVPQEVVQQDHLLEGAREEKDQTPAITTTRQYLTQLKLCAH